MAGRNGEWSMVAAQNHVLLSPAFPPASFSKIVIFSYIISPGFATWNSMLQLHYLNTSCASCWALIWSAPDGSANVWREAKVSLPADAVALKFMAEDVQVSSSIAVDNIFLGDRTDFQESMQLSLGGDHTCVKRAFKGDVLCWGSNYVYDDILADGDPVVPQPGGQLGQGHGALNVGDDADEMGENLPAVSLGTGRSARQIVAGSSHTCAVLDDDSVKCWGYNYYGQLGQGHGAFNAGDDADEMGDNLPAISLGTGRSARQIAAGSSHTCALLDDDSVKCWGYNYYGQLGQGHRSNVGDDADEMGDNLPAISLGTGRSARQIAAGSSHTCAVLDDDSVKCWGYNYYGQLGQGHGAYAGDDADEMGDNLPAISLGTGRSARQITAGHSHTCALLDDDSVKCWGYNLGQLGQGHRSNVGDDADEMGDNLPAISLGTARQIAAGYHHTCALLDDDSVKCWGNNHYGQLGQGESNSVGGFGYGSGQYGYGYQMRSNVRDDVGDDADEMGDNLPPISLGTGRFAQQIAAGGFNTCALLDDDSVKCWGHNRLGQLGQGHTSNIGDNADEMGDNLPFVLLPTANFSASVQVRLGPRSACCGRVEVLYDGVWGSVCDDAWSDANAKVSCKQLGLAGGVATWRVGGGSGPIWMHRVRCLGNETNLGHCEFRGWGAHNCSHVEDAGVECHFDAWSDFSVISSHNKPSPRAQHSSTWLDNEQSILIFAGRTLDPQACGACQVSTGYTVQAGLGVLYVSAVLPRKCFRNTLYVL